MAPCAAAGEFAGAFNEAPLSIVAAARLLALLNVVMYETVLLHVDASRSAVDPFNNDGSCPARVAAVNASASCPRFVALKDLGNSIAPLAASYAAHYTLSTLYPTKAGTGGSTLTNIRFDNVLKNHQQARERQRAAAFFSSGRVLTRLCWAAAACARRRPPRNSGSTCSGPRLRTTRAATRPRLRTRR